MEINQNSNKKSHKVRNGVVGAVVFVVLLAIIGSTEKNTPTVSNTPANASTTTTSTPAASNPTPAPAAPLAKVGDTINIGGDQGLPVKLIKIIDPAQGNNQYFTPDPGKRFVAAEVQLTNSGTSSVQDDANNNMTIIGSDDQSYTSTVYSIVGCTDFSDGEYTLSAGASGIGCVNFQLPNGVKAAKLQFQTNSGIASDTGEWIAN